ncbi:hypothetical protein GC101_35390 [Paenibacillus sp. LMG 31459]|uniref:Uncharacterized protein n=1 Tax=Paenibacillus phytohabitans TaxID=2654978 RepID=A0ABX1YWA1_9BACL|nr:hypothetical protein [Paenibacillus phytohabitans]NOU84136.1 hypothetical protein [Paenibacillus phytohabitans]
MREDTIVTLSYTELSRIVGIYFSQKLGNPTPTELRLIITHDGVNVEVKLWTVEKLIQMLDFD